MTEIIPSGEASDIYLSSTTDNEVMLILDFTLNLIGCVCHKGKRRHGQFGYMLSIINSFPLSTYLYLPELFC